MDAGYSCAGLWALLAATFILAVSHTMSPDHWFPFVMVGKARKWRISWILCLAGLAGIGHVGTSVAIGLVGVLAEQGASKEIASFLENATPVLLMTFGFGYAIYALRKRMVGRHGHSHGIPFINKLLGIDPHALQIMDRGHRHEPRPASKKDLHFGRVNLYLHNMDIHIRLAHDDHLHYYDATKHEDHYHEHAHAENVHNHAHHHHVSSTRPHTPGGHEHGGAARGAGHTRAGWGLVAILGLTPCIALLPLTFAAVKYGTMAVILVNAVFAVATICTILLFTWLGTMGLSFIKLDFFDEYGDILAGVIIGLLGVVTQVFKL